jgi:hypothetical protein
MNKFIAQLQEEIEPIRQKIIRHEIYSNIRELEDLNIFMQYHVFAVWDFMSLLKTLQRELTCTSAPWFPKGDADTRYLINEIVAGEESDIDRNGIRTSHYEMYLKAMQQIGASVHSITEFTKALQNTTDMNKAFENGNVPEAVQQFVSFTFDVIKSGKAHLQSAVFTFGREDLIPSMFLSLVNEMSCRHPEKVSEFKYYLERHIEVDGGHHSHLALNMTEILCENNADKWLEASEVVKESLLKRLQLWDGALAAITKNKTTC